MNSEQQYIDLYQQAREMIFSHAPEAMNAVRDEAFEDFRRQGFPSKKVERYKYTDIQKLFAPDYGVNLNRLEIPVDPYEAFRCDVPNLSTSLYFVVNDMFYRDDKPKGHLPEGVNKLQTPETSCIVITHYDRLLEMIRPQYVHVLYKGRIVKTGGPELATQIQEHGYDWIKEEIGEE